MWTEKPRIGTDSSSSMRHSDTDLLFGLTTSFDGQGAVWQLSPQHFATSADGGGEGGGYDVTKVAGLSGHTDKILSCAYSPLTHDIITSGADGNVLSWSPTNIALSSSSSSSS
jgi:hypothetical protein